MRKGGLVAVTRTVAGADETVEADVGMVPPEAVEELSDEVDDFLNDFLWLFLKFLVYR